MSDFLWGYEGILWVQSIGQFLLDWLAVAASFLGTETFYMLFVPVFYWCLDKRAGIRLAMVLLLSSYLNTLSKEFFEAVRPDPDKVRVHYASSGSGYSFPSGHAQNAVVFWGWLARVHPMRRFAWVFGILILLISWSRVYLGLHFPGDVLGGWLFGLLLFVVFILIDSRISREPRDWEGRILPWAGVVLPVVFLPLQSSGIQVRISGAMLGFCLGYLIESRLIGFSPRVSWKNQILKVTGGWSVGAALALLTRVFFSQRTELAFISYGVLGLWVSLGLPAAYWWVAQRREGMDIAGT